MRCGFILNYLFFFLLVLFYCINIKFLTARGVNSSILAILKVSTYIYTYITTHVNNKININAYVPTYRVALFKSVYYLFAACKLVYTARLMSYRVKVCARLARDMNLYYNSNHRKFLSIFTHTLSSSSIVCVHCTWSHLTIQNNKVTAVWRRRHYVLLLMVIYFT